MNKVDLVTIAGAAVLANRATGLPMFKGAALVGGALAASRSADAPPLLREFAALLRQPATRLLGDSADGSCCKSCAAGGPCSGEKPQKTSPVIDAEFVAVPS